MGRTYPKGKGTRLAEVTQEQSRGHQRSTESVRTGSFFACCWILKSCSAKTINIGLSESVALASVSEVGGGYSHFAITNQTAKASGRSGAVRGSSRLRGPSTEQPVQCLQEGTRPEYTAHVPGHSLRCLGLLAGL